MNSSPIKASKLFVGEVCTWRTTVNSEVGETDDILNPHKDWITTSTSPLQVCCDQQYFTPTEGPDSRRPYTSLTPVLLPFISIFSTSHSLTPTHKLDQKLCGCRLLLYDRRLNLQRCGVEFVITTLKLCRLSRHSSRFNRHLNINASLARAREPESVCVCLMPECLKCQRSAPLSFSFSARLSFLRLCCSCICRRHNIRTLPLLIEPIWLLPLSLHPLHNTLSQNCSPVPLLHPTEMSSFDLNMICSECISSHVLFIWATACPPL